MSRPSLRAKIVLYLTIIHATLGGVAWIVLSQNRWLLLGAELFFAVSIIVGVLFVRSLFGPLRMLRTGAELIREGDFTTRFRPVGQPELDALVVLYNDMIERLRLERLRAEEQHSFLEKVLEASPGAVVTLDYDGRASLVNPSAARLLGARPDQILGKPLAEIAHPLVAGFASLGAHESRVLTLPGGRRIKASHATFFDRGHPRSFYLAEELTDELRATEKSAYEKLIRMVSHEVNNSVGAVRSLLESLHHYDAQVRDADRGDFQGALDVAIGRMNSLNAFMRGFADVVRIPAPERAPCDVRALIDDILILLRPELQRRRIQAAWNGAATIGPVSCDKNLMEQALVNILKNAIEAIGEDGMIVLGFHHDSRRSVLSIRDSGAGIAESSRAMLFTPFYSTKRDGRGLGLTVVREILASHHFDYTLEPVAGGGAEFRITF